MKPFDLSVLFFLQLAVILVTCRIVGWFARFLGQPQVVSEMIAGVCLGPSLFGLLAPQLHAQLFPKDSIPILFAVSQVGLSLYMFIVGMDFRLELFQSRVRTAVTVSLAGMITPFILGAVLALSLHQTGGYFPEPVRSHEAMLFLGAALCITAFPMLARIIIENGLAGTTLGTLALAAGALDDVAAWCLLAIVLSSADRSWDAALWAIGGGAIYAVFVLVGARRLLSAWLPGWLSREDNKQSVTFDGQSSTAGLPMPMLVLILAMLMFSSFVTDKIGIYAVFGAFILGCAMPRGQLISRLRYQIEPMTVGLLLPMFFTFSGLSTRLDLLTSTSAITVTLLVLLIATLGKGIACWAAARLAGENQPTAAAIGALMNARGLMELIMLNIGLQRGIVDEKLFSIMVVMAILTTVAASPFFIWVRNRFGREAFT